MSVYLYILAFIIQVKHFCFLWISSQFSMDLKNGRSESKSEYNLIKNVVVTLYQFILRELNKWIPWRYNNQYQINKPKMLIKNECFYSLDNKLNKSIINYMLYDFIISALTISKIQLKSRLYGTWNLVTSPSIRHSNGSVRLLQVLTASV